MPDWFSHILVVLIILKFVKTEHANLLVLASVMPDVDHVPLLFSRVQYEPGMAFLMGGRFLHTLLGVLALSLIVSYFRPKALKPVFAVGCIHIMMDMMIGYAGIPVFFPFYTGNLGIPLLPNYTPWLPVLLSVLYLAIFFSFRAGLSKYQSGKQKLSLSQTP